MSDLYYLEFLLSCFCEIGRKLELFEKHQAILGPNRDVSLWLLSSNHSQYDVVTLEQYCTVQCTVCITIASQSLIHVDATPMPRERAKYEYELNKFQLYEDISIIILLCRSIVSKIGITSTVQKLILVH